jgi:hypothetical protein
MIILAIKKLRQKDYKLEVSLEYIMRFCLKKQGQASLYTPIILTTQEVGKGSRFKASPGKKLARPCLNTSQQWWYASLSPALRKA